MGLIKNVIKQEKKITKSDQENKTLKKELDVGQTY